MTNKICTVCKKEKPLSEFSNRGRCKICRSADRKKFYNENKQRLAVIQKEYDYNHRYGITKKDYDEMYLLRGGRCDICKKRYDVLQVDHDHNSKKIRGLLCPTCNRAIGLMKDDVLIIAEAGRYLSRR